MKKRNLLNITLLAVLATSMACSGDTDLVAEQPEQPAELPTWRVCINAEPAGNNARTRAISVGGNDGKTLYTNWDEGDLVEVVDKANTSVGSLSASVSAGNSAFATLSGELSGTYAVGDDVTLFNHSATQSYEGQTGTLASVSTTYAYLQATSSVKEVDNEGKFLTMSNAAFSHLQAFLNVTFTDPDGTSIAINQLEIWTDGGKLVKAFDATGDNHPQYATEESPLVVTPEKITNHFFLSLRDDNGASNTFRFKAVSSQGIFKGTAESNLQSGHYYIGTLKLSFDSGSIGRYGYGNGESWDTEGIVVIGRGNYGNGSSLDYDVTVGTNRSNYGNGNSWDYNTTGGTGRNNYGEGSNW